MNWPTWLRGSRLFLGFLLAPAVVPLTLHVSLSVVAAYLGLNLSELDADSLRSFVLTFGVGMVYLCVLCLGVPYVLLLSKAGRLNFRTITVTTLMVSWVYSVLVYVSLQKDFSFAGTVAALCMPGVILSGLCFYFIGVWKSQEIDTGISPLLEAYLGHQKPNFQV
jgi:hypothetical protein